MNLGLPARAPLARAAVAVVLMLAACAAPADRAKAPPAAALPTAASSPAEASPPSGDQSRISGRILPDREQGAAPIIRQPGGAGIIGKPAAQPLVSENGDITLNYVDTDIREIIRLILGDILKVNYAIDPGYQGLVTIRTARPLKREELLPTLQGLVAQTGGSMIYQNGIFRIGAAGSEGVIPPIVGESSFETGTQLVPLRYASAKQLAAMLQPYLGEGGRMVADPTRNVLIVQGSAPARQNLIGLIKVFDVDYLAGQSYALFPVKSGEPSKVAAELQSALQLDSDGPLAGAMKVIALDQANAVMVVAHQQSYVDRAARLVAQLDEMGGDAGRNLHVYYLKNAQASDLQPILQRAVNPPSGEEAAPPGGLPPTAEPSQISTAAPSQGFTPGLAGAAAAPAASPAGGLAAATLGPQTGAAAASASSPPPPPDLGTTQQVAGGNPKGPRIIADPQSNALIVVATEAEYADIEAAIRRLDVLPLQVLIEATVAEVTLNDALQYGTQFFLSKGSNAAILSNAQSLSTTTSGGATVPNTTLFPGTLAPNFPGFAIARTASSIQYALEALKSVTDVRVISAPKLLILDHQKARLQVGSLVPILTQTVTSAVTATATIANSVQYQETGVILTVTPKINAGGLVTLDIDQEVSSVLSNSSGPIGSPTFQERRVQSDVVVQSGDTISLAGLISDTRENDNAGVPILSDIPLVGGLFSTKNHSDKRTELLVLITPRVVYDQRGARALTDELRRKLPGPASLVP